MVFLPREEGQGLVEYGLVLVLIAVVIVAVLTLLGSQISALFSRIAEAIP
jgi:pilus assembly protein Flp/PilA